MKAKILQSAPITWYGTLISTLSPVAGQDIRDVGQSIAYLEETNKSQEQLHTGLQERPKTERELEKPKGYPEGL